MVYTYICGEMQWSSLGQSGAAVVGYNSEGNFFQNHPASGFSSIADIVSCGVNQERRRKRQEPQPLTPIMPLDVDPVIRNEAIDCNNRFDLDKSIVDSMNLTDLLSGCPCPPTLRHALTDAARFVQHTRSPLCYVSTVSNCNKQGAVSAVVTVTAAHQCCYDDNG